MAYTKRPFIQTTKTVADILFGVLDVQVDVFLVHEVKVLQLLDIYKSGDKFLTISLLRMESI